MDLSKFLMRAVPFLSENVEFSPPCIDYKILELVGHEDTEDLCCHKRDPDKLMKASFNIRWSLADARVRYTGEDE